MLPSLTANLRLAAAAKMAPWNSVRLQLQTACSLQLQVAIDERDCELVWLDVDADRARRADTTEGALALPQVVGRGGAVEAVHPRRKRAADDRLTQRSEHHQMARAQQLQRRQQCIVVLVAQVGNQNYQRAPAH